MKCLSNFFFPVLSNILRSEILAIGFEFEIRFRCIKQIIQNNERFENEGYTRDEQWLLISFHSVRTHHSHWPTLFIFKNYYRRHESSVSYQNGMKWEWDQTQKIETN